MKQQVLRLLGVYQSYRALRPAACRFQPTCSHYALDAIDNHGVMRGSWLVARRICRCHPLGGHGYDPVPAARPTTAPLAAAFGSPTVRTPCD